MKSDKQVQIGRPLTRRALISGSLLAAGTARSRAAGTLPFPIVDYHAHLSPQLSIEKILELSRERNVGFGIVEHPGPKQKIQTDSDLERYIANLRKYNVYVGVQPIYPGWSAGYSKPLVERLDYVLMDALTLPEDNGAWTEIWRPETVVKDEAAFMKRYVNFIVRILSTEKIDIFAWPTFLPACIAKNYSSLWTKERREQIIELARAKKIAIELNEFAKVPDADFILLAKSAGLKFTFGSDARNESAGRLPFGIDMARRCGLTRHDMFTVDRKSK